MRLRRSDPARPGLTRRGHGRGFSYCGPDGRRLTDPEVVERLRGLAVPPAWSDVWLCPYPNGHIQAVGTDDAGRRQYVYHEEWRLSQDADKHDRVRRLARRLPAFRSAVDEELCAEGLGRDRVLAVALRMLDHGVFRTGNTEYAEDYGSRGVATLLRTDVRVNRGLLMFDFTAKGGKRRTIELDDEHLVAAVSSLKRSRHRLPLLLVHRASEGWHEIDAGLINERFRQLVGDDYSVKDLRTWNATVRAATALSDGSPSTTGRAARSSVKAMLAEVSDHLGNTPTVARGSYVDPRVIEQFERGRTVERAIRRAGSDDLSRPAVRAALERSVLRLLSRSN